MLTQFADYHMHAYAPFEKGLETFETMASLGITDANLLAYTYIETGIDNNIVCLYYQEKCQKMNLRTFGGLYYDRDLNHRIMPYREQAELLLAMGCTGIKFLDMKPNYNLYCGCSMDDAVYDDLYEMLEKRQIPLVAHIADPANFWHREQMLPGAIARGWCYEDSKFLTQQQMFDCTLRRLEKNPNLYLCLAHFGFLSQRLELCYEICERFPHVTFDLTPGWEIFVDFAKDVSGWQTFFNRYSERILYGTDTSTNSSAEHVCNLRQTMIETVSHDTQELPIPHFPQAMMRGLALQEQAQKNICYENYQKLLGTTHKKVNLELYRYHARTIRAIASQNGDEAMLKTLDIAMDI